MAEKIARLTRWLVPATMLLTVAALAAWWFTSPSEVTVHVDGERISLSTRASTVGDVLSERGIELEAHDRVVPPLEAVLEDGEAIRVVRARAVTVDLNGALRRVWTTGRTVDDLLDELALTPDEVAPAGTTRLAEGITVRVRDAHEVTVVADGEARPLLTTALTVEEVLADLGIDRDGDDEVAPAPGTALTPGLTITVTRVDSTVAVEEHTIANRIVRRDDPNLTRGSVRVVQEGRPGLERIEYRLVRRDGEVVERTELSRTVVREPETRILAIGTKDPNHSFGQASWYNAGSMTCAHRSLPFGTRVTVVNRANGRSVVCRVADRGPFVAGRIVDLAYDAFQQLADPSVGVIDVRISW
ncbi:MAG TPA: ubiquitin-like domain-containing protein [Acidimicrobiia bacterium]|nr:ubiquitin-like domain-containing protein [Acidimicrobiia bacterium]